MTYAPKRPHLPSCTHLGLLLVLVDDSNKCRVGDLTCPVAICKRNVLLKTDGYTRSEAKARSSLLTAAFGLSRKLRSWTGVQFSLLSASLSAQPAAVLSLCSQVVAILACFSANSLLPMRRHAHVHTYTRREFTCHTHSLSASLSVSACVCVCVCVSIRTYSHTLRLSSSSSSLSLSLPSLNLSISLSSPFLSLFLLLLLSFFSFLSPSSFFSYSSLPCCSLSLFSFLSHVKLSIDWPVCDRHSGRRPSSSRKSLAVCRSHSMHIRLTILSSVPYPLV